MLLPNNLARKATPLDSPEPAPMSDPSPSLDLQFPGTSGQVRRTLVHVRRHLLAQCHSKETVGKAEIVLAEIMNNIVEHALPGVPDGQISLNCRAVPGGWAFAICDNGREMPGGVIPGPRLPDIGTSLQDLPEGGFGWALVHMLSTDIAYERIAGQNCLSFRLLT